MGLLLYPVFDPPARSGSRTSGEGLAAHFEAIDVAAARLGLTPLTAFADNRPIPEGFAGDPDDLRELMGPCLDWFDPEEGRLATAALADAIGTRPEAFPGIDAHVRAVLEAELRDLSQALARATARGLRFRLELS